MYHTSQTPKSSTRNTLNLDVPGLTSNLSIRFPDCRLPVCGRCKKNYKTRDMCRTQGEHTELPWSTVFICITLDHTCTDANNNLRNGPFVARSMDWMPYCFKSEVGPKTLICAACKTKNYTRKQCRMKSRHRFLPWSTVYVTLSCGEDLVRSEGKRGIDDNLSEYRGKRRAVGDDKPLKSVSSANDLTSNADDEEEEKNDRDIGDDITKVDKSRTFLLEVSVDTCNIKWLDYDKSKALPGQNYLQDTTAARYRSLVAHQAQMYGNPPRAYGYPLDTTSNSQMFPTDTQQRPYPSQLYMHNSGYPNWHAGVSGVPMLAHNNPVGRAIAIEEQTEYQQHPYWNSEQHEQQLQTIPRAWPAGYQVPYDSNLMQQNMTISQVQGQGAYPPNAYSEHDPENAHYNAAQQQSLRHRNEISTGI